MNNDRSTDLMSPEDAEQFTASLGMIVGGTWKQVAWADRQGIPAALGLSTREWVEQRLGGYVRLSISERRDAVAELIAEGMSQREIAEVLGVGQATVSRMSDPNESSNQDKSPTSDPNGSTPKPIPPLEESLAKLDRAAEGFAILERGRAERERFEERLQAESTAHMNQLRDACRRLLDVLAVLTHLPEHEQTEAREWLRILTQEVARRA